MAVAKDSENQFTKKWEIKIKHNIESLPRLRWGRHESPLAKIPVQQQIGPGEHRPACLLAYASCRLKCLGGRGEAARSCC